MAPVAVKVVEFPAHTLAGLADAVITGKGITVIFMTVDDEQDPSSPVTVYWVLDVGVKITGFVVKPPGYQV